MKTPGADEHFNLMVHGGATHRVKQKVSGRERERRREKETEREREKLREKERQRERFSILYIQTPDRPPTRLLCYYY